MPSPAPSPTAEFGLRRIGQIAVTVHELERAVRFYRDALGMPLLFEAPPALAFFDCGGVRLMLTLPEGTDGPRGTSIIYYAVDDIQRAFTALTSRGVGFISAPHMVARMPDHDLWLVECRDSEDNVLALMSEVRR